MDSRARRRNRLPPHQRTSILSVLWRQSHARALGCGGGPRGIRPGGRLLRRQGRSRAEPRRHRQDRRRPDVHPRTSLDRSQAPCPRAAEERGGGPGGRNARPRGAAQAPRRADEGSGLQHPQAFRGHRRMERRVVRARRHEPRPLQGHRLFQEPLQGADLPRRQPDRDRFRQRRRQRPDAGPEQPQGSRRHRRQARPRDPTRWPSA